MSNLIVNPGFEAGETDWTFTGRASVQTNAVEAHSGTKYCRLAIHPSTNIGGVVDQIFNVTAGTTYQLAYWIKLTKNQGDLNVELFNVDSSKAVDQLHRGADHRDWTQYLHEFTPNDSQVRLVFSAQYNTDGSFTALIDDTSVVEASSIVAITNTLKSAIVTDLGTITTANGYSTTVEETGVEPKRFDEVKFPAVFIVPGEGGDSELAELTNRTGDTTQRYTLQIILKSTTPNEDIDDLLDDIRNAIEVATSTTMETSGVLWAGVESWNEITNAPEIHENVYIREAVAAVRYVYTRGAA